jgi:seryl-tRNA synthetase
MANLYELSAGYATILDAYDAAETDEEREELLSMLASAGEEINDKAENYARVIRMKEEEAKAFKAEADRLTKRKQAAENMVARLKAALLDSMKLTGQTEIKTSIGKWRVQMNPVSADVTDWTKVPMEFRTPQPDKVDKPSLIKRYKETGEVFEGVEFKQEQGIRFR